jgi:hypothetical protein
MSERNEMVAQLLADVPARDLMFEIALLTRIEQRRFRRGLAWTVVAAMGISVLLAFAMPGLEGVWQQNFAGLFSNTMIAAMLFAMLLPAQQWIMRRA